MKRETIVELISLALDNKSEVSGKAAFQIGEKYFIRTVTHYMVGKLEEECDGMLIFSSASWIADTGRFADFLKTGEASEVEPVKGLYRLAKGAIVDAFDFEHTLPNKQK